MPTEQSPLLLENIAQCNLPAQDIYDRFNDKQKRLILIIISLTGFIPMFVRACFVPCIPQMSRDLNATPATVSQGVSLAVLATSFGVMFWSSYSSFYGRRAIYLWGMPITVLSSFALAASTSMNGLLFWRFMQSFGCSCGYVIGAAAIGDIYILEERGTAMGTFVGAMLSGLAFAPPIGGIFAQHLSWRWLHITLGVWSLAQILLLFFFFPETAHPGSRGIDETQQENKFFIWINPFRCLTFLRSPNIMAVTLASGLVLMTDFVLLIPIAYTVGAKYGIVNEGLVGMLFIPNGLGNLVGAPIGGSMSDVVVRKVKEKRKGIWVPEDRLRVAWIGGLILVPVSITVAGFATTYVDGMTGLVINIICLFINGVGVDTFLTPIGVYTVDILPSRSAEVMAALTAMQSIIIAILSALCLPAVEIIGVAATNSVAGILALFGYFLVWLTVRCGEQMRAYADVGYPDFLARRSDCDETTAQQN